MLARVVRMATPFGARAMSTGTGIPVKGEFLKALKAFKAVPVPTPSDFQCLAGKVTGMSVRDAVDSPHADSFRDLHALCGNYTQLVDATHSYLADVALNDLYKRTVDGITAAIKVFDVSRPAVTPTISSDV